MANNLSEKLETIRTLTELLKVMKDVYVKERAQKDDIIETATKKIEKALAEI